MRGTLTIRASSGPPIQVKATKRREIPLPSPVPIMHSSAYIEQTRAGSNEAEQTEPKAIRKALPTKSSSSSSSGGLLMETLQSIDDHLQSIEEKPSPLHQTLFDMSQGPVAQAAGRGLEAAAGMTLKVGEALAPTVRKVAAPVAEWALSNGTKAAQALVLEAARRIGESRSKGEGDTRKRK